jgi:hypothetical protein
MLLYPSSLESADSIRTRLNSISGCDSKSVDIVFEHISYEYIEDTIISLRQYSKCLFAVIPLGDGKKYYIPSYELDKTHIIKEDKDWWIDLFKKCGFKDVSFEYKIKGIKENYNKIEKGNGFFILR